MELVYPNEVFSEKYNVVLLTIVEGVKLLPTRQKSSTQCLQRFNKIYLSSSGLEEIKLHIKIKNNLTPKIVKTKLKIIQNENSNLHF